jgi:hypothetical protein
MNLGEWIEAFRSLHERAREGKLSDEEATDYRAGREELARALVASQRIALKPGESPRKALRVARALQVQVGNGAASVRATTADLCVEGFSALLAKAPRAGEELACTLRLPGGQPLAAAARVVEAKPLGGNSRVFFAFKDLPEAERERLEMLVFDTLLAQLVK